MIYYTQDSQIRVFIIHYATGSILYQLDILMSIIDIALCINSEWEKILISWQKKWCER